MVDRGALPAPCGVLRAEPSWYFHRGQDPASAHDAVVVVDVVSVVVVGLDANWNIEGDSSDHT